MMDQAIVVVDTDDGTWRFQPDDLPRSDGRAVAFLRDDLVVFEPLRRDQEEALFVSQHGRWTHYRTMPLDVFHPFDEYVRPSARPGSDSPVPPENRESHVGALEPATFETPRSERESDAN
jgi:hypothetical protein